MRGGKREGSGRKAVGSHKINFVCPDELYEWLQKNRQHETISSVIVTALRHWRRLMGM